MVLSEVRNNGIYHVRQLHDGAGDIHRHLENLGFVPGEQIVVVSRIGGNLIVNVKVLALRFLLSLQSTSRYSGLPFPAKRKDEEGRHSENSSRS